ncbi:MAG: hypothetical protein IJ903_08095 [Ruminococcus sp.]|nr:hypothetical protein [Ruminococcus sp.]
MDYLRQSSLFKGFEDEEIEAFLKGVEHSFIEIKANEKYEFPKERYVLVLSGLLVNFVTNIKGGIDNIQGSSPFYNELLFFYGLNVDDEIGKRLFYTVFTPSVIAKYDFESWKHLLDNSIKRIYESLHKTLLYTNEKQDFDLAVQTFEDIN